LHVNLFDWYYPGVDSHLPGTLFLRNLVERRSLLFQLVRRDFQQRYVGSAAGWLWGIIHPLVLLLSYTFVFSICLKQKPGTDPLSQNYPLFLVAGLLPWLLFSETVTRSSSSLIEQAALITKTVFPAEIVPLAIFLSSLVSHLIAITLVVIGAAVVLRTLSPALVLLPLMTLLLGLFAVGIGWIASSLQVYLRDTAQVLTVALTFWFWLTPIFISEDKFPQRLRFLITANPLAYIVRAYRELLLGVHVPPLGDVAIAAAFCIATFFAGGMFFRYMKRGFADVL
jgi:lipopolysaccharide transport system permease protein